jgi:hypothetical protein
MTAPPTTQLAADAYALLEPVWAGDDQRGYPLLTFLGGLGEAFRQVEEIARAQQGREPYQQAYDIDRAPDWFLPFLGQFVGVPVVPGADPSVQRQQIRAEAGFVRGRPSTLVSAVQATLTGMQRVELRERFTDAWTIDVRTLMAETPDTTKTANAAQAAKATGLVMTVGTRSIPLVDDGTKTVDLGTATVDTATFTDV